MTARRRIQWAGNFTFQGYQSHRVIGIRSRYSRKQRFGIGMAWMIEKLRCRSNFHQPTQIHNSHLVGNMLDHAQIMGNEQIGEIELTLQVIEQVQNFRLDGYIQSRNGFIAHDKLRV